MADIDLYKGFAPEKQAEYEAYLVDRYGEGVRARIDVGKARMAALTPDQMQAHMDELAGIEADLAGALTAGIAADDPVLDALLARHHAWVATAWDQAPTREAYAGLGELYASHPDFVARYDQLARGMAPWLATAMAAFAGRRL